MCRNPFLFGVVAANILARFVPLPPPQPSEIKLPPQPNAHKSRYMPSRRPSAFPDYSRNPRNYLTNNEAYHVSKLPRPDRQTVLNHMGAFSLMNMARAQKRDRRRIEGDVLKRLAIYGIQQEDI